MKIKYNFKNCYINAIFNSLKATTGQKLNEPILKYSLSCWFRLYNFR